MSATITKLRAPSDPLAEDRRTALGILSFLAEGASRAHEGADTLTRLSPYERELLRRAAVALVATIDILTPRMKP